MEQRVQNCSFSFPWCPVRPCHRHDFSGLATFLPMGRSALRTVLGLADTGVLSLMDDLSEILGLLSVDLG